MTTKRIVFTNKDGGVEVVYPSSGGRFVWAAKDHGAAARADNKAASLAVAETAASDARVAAAMKPKDEALAGVARDLAAMALRLKADADAAAALVVADFRPTGVPVDRLQKIVADTGRKIEILEQESEAEWLARVRMKAVPNDAKDISIVEVGNLPKDRSARNAWVWNGGKVVIDQAKATALAVQS